MVKIDSLCVYSVFHSPHFRSSVQLPNLKMKFDLDFMRNALPNAPV